MAALSPGDLIPESDLPNLAREAWERSGLTQTALSDEFGVSQSSVAQALTDRAGMTALRLRILERCGGVAVEGPVYHVKAVEAPASDA